MGIGGLGSSFRVYVSTMLRDQCCAVARETDLARVACLEEAGSAVKD
jgi:hypothetical protein